MKNLARVFTFGSFLVAGAAGMFACFPLAPSGGDVPDASSDGGGYIDAGTVFDVGLPSKGGGSEAGDGGDASSSNSDAIAPVAPGPSTVLAAGDGFACRIDGQGNVLCWGKNTFGQAGVSPSALVDGGGPLIAHPTRVAGVANAIALALGDAHACAVMADAGVSCWGLNNSFQLGHTSGDGFCSAGGGSAHCNAVPQQVTGASAVEIGAAGAWTCAVTPAGSVQCWGAIQSANAATAGSDPVFDGSIPCGAGTAATGASCFPTPYTVPSVSGVVQLAVGFDHACAVQTGAAVWCWGANTEAQVAPVSCGSNGNNDCTAGQNVGLPPSSSVAAGFGFTCALAVDGGAVTCVGDNSVGQIGEPTDASFSFTPVGVGGLGAASELVAGGGANKQSACVIIDGGAVQCWGNVAGDAAAGVPVTISGLPPMNALGVPDSTYECGIANDHSTWCWDLAAGTAPAQIQ